MKQKFYGVITMILAGSAVIIASAIIFIKSPILGFIYLGILFIAVPAVIYVYCAKCSYKRNCPHILPGKAAMCIDRETEPYTKTEITAVIISFLLILGIPQFWLSNHLISLIIFWFLIIISFLLIPIRVCPYCENTYCPLIKTKENE